MTAIKALYGSHGKGTNGYMLDLRGAIAQDLVKHYGIIAGAEDGEDSAGRRAIRLQTPEEIVIRACDMADILVNTFETRGWLTVYSPEETVEVTEESLTARALAEAKAFDAKYETRKAK